MAALLSLEDLQALIKKRIGSRAWWLLFAPRDLVDVSSAIENRFYKGPKNADFQLVMTFGLIPGDAFFLAHKRWMSRAALQKWAKRKGYPIPSLNPEQDMLIFIGPTSGNEDVAREFSQWLTAMYSGDGLPRRIDLNLN